MPFSCQTQSDKPWYITYGCTLNYGSMVDNGPFTYTYTANGSASLTTIQAGSTWGVNAYSVQLAWQASDLLTITTSTTHSDASSGSSTSGPGVVTVTAGSTSSAGQDSKELSNGGLSSTAKIAVGVVIPVVVLSAIAIGAFLLMRRRKSRPRDLSTQEKTSGAIDYGKAEYHSGSAGRYDVVDKYQKHEMSSESAPQRLIHELDSGRGR